MSPATRTASASRAGRKVSRPEDWLIGGGEMGKLLRSMDWGRTPLGPLASWPQSLRTTVSLCLASSFPISIAWGPSHVQIYNDGYFPICGGKHPHSMGEDFRQCWASAWPVIGEAFDRALAGETSFLENQRMFFDRNGYLEETFFTFSFSPIRDESGGVGGLFHPVTETTNRMLSERRTRTLRDVAARTATARTSEKALALVGVTLAESELDIPFALLYLVDAAGTEARLAGHAGLPPGLVASPRIVDLSAAQPPSSWPLAESVRSNQAMRVDCLEQRFGPLTCGPYPESPKIALVLPITPPGCERPAAILIAGSSSRIPLTESYRAFFDLLAAAVTTAVANARAEEEERSRAKEMDRAKTEFFSNVSHEFRTPLMLMLGPLEDELAERASPLPDARRERLEVAHRNAFQLLKLVNTLLDFSRVEAGRIQASYVPTDLATCTVELASMFRSVIEKAGLSFTVDCPPLPQPLFVDREMWEKIVLNLLSNAFKYTFTGGITATLRWHGDHAELAITDSGVGIAASELPRLFERFHRVRGTKSRTHEGTGIGLSLVKELAAAHGGVVRVESVEAKGSTFRVTVRAGHAHLPAERIGTELGPAPTANCAAAYVEAARLWTRDGSASTAISSVSEEPRASCAAGPRPRIILADDNADMRHYVCRLLASRYEVQVVPDGSAALSAALAAPPDLVLTDVMMPVLDGFGLLRGLRADTRTHTVPVILLSARAGEESAVEGLDAGADDYLVKPFSARELLARVRTHLDLARLRRKWAVELEHANKELDSFSYSVCHDLRAPLRAISGFGKALLTDQTERLDAQGRSHLGRILAASARMSALIDDLLGLSRITRCTLARETVSVTDVARSVIGELRARDPERNVDVDLTEDLTVQADPRLFRIAVENLLGNAWKFTGKRKEARIAVGKVVGDGQQAFFVRDNGAGFDMQHADTLFQAFQRFHTQSEFEGTGIGLATVNRIVSRHGGRMWAEAAVDAGATFFFTMGASS